MRRPRPQWRSRRTAVPPRGRWQRRAGGSRHHPMTRPARAGPGALAQAWRNPARQVRLVRVVSSDGVVIHPLEAASARAAGQLCAATATADVVDASVVLVARVVNGVTVTSDVDDLRRLDQGINLVRC